MLRFHAKNLMMNIPSNYNVKCEKIKKNHFEIHHQIFAPNMKSDELTLKSQDDNSIKLQHNDSFHVKKLKFHFEIIVRL